MVLLVARQEHCLEEISSWGDPVAPVPVALYELKIEKFRESTLPDSMTARMRYSERGDPVAPLSVISVSKKLRLHGLAPSENRMTMNS